jgi:hypothetical protein
MGECTLDGQAFGDPLRGGGKDIAEAIIFVFLDAGSSGQTSKPHPVAVASNIATTGRGKNFGAVGTTG